MTKSFKEKVFLITYGIILFVLLSNYKWMIDLISNLWKIVYPFILGLFIAGILNIVMSTYEKNKYIRNSKYKRAISLSLSVVSVVAIVVFLIVILVPELNKAGSLFVNNIPEYKQNISDIGKKLGMSKKSLETITKSNWTNSISKYVRKNYNHIFNIASSIFSTLYNFTIGFIFALYILVDKDKLGRQLNKLLKKVLPKKVFDRVMIVSDMSYKSFSDFMKIQSVDACILGFLCFIGMLLFGFPYAAPVSVLIGVTALIPVFGGLVGCIIGAFLIFMTNPIRGITFIVYFIILQQIDNNLIYPNVVGNKVGLPSIWVLVAVIIGGGIGGVIGMLLGIPILSMLYSYLRVYVNGNKKEVKGNE